jgi:hypothetical protein
MSSLENRHLIGREGGNTSEPLESRPENAELATRVFASVMYGRGRALVTGRQGEYNERPYPAPRRPVDRVATMRASHRAILAVFVVFLAVTALRAADASGEEKWIQLFNGKDLSGWKVKIKGYELGDNHGNTFRVEDGVMKVAYDRYKKFDGKFGHIFYEKPFSHYVLRVEYRFVGEQCPGGPGWAFRNSGAMIHGQSPESMGKDQDFPVSIEVQLLGGSGSGTRPTANVCTPGTHFVQNGQLVTRHCNSSTSRTIHGDRWVTVEIEVHGSKLIRHFVDGEKVFEYTQPQLDENDAQARKMIEARGGEKLLSGGSISLQAESHPVEFRKVELKELNE